MNSGQTRENSSWLTLIEHVKFDESAWESTRDDESLWEFQQTRARVRTVIIYHLSSSSGPDPCRPNQWSKEIKQLIVPSIFCRTSSPRNGWSSWNKNEGFLLMKPLVTIWFYKKVFSNQLRKRSHYSKRRYLITLFFFFYTSSYIITNLIFPYMKKPSRNRISTGNTKDRQNIFSLQTSAGECCNQGTRHIEYKQNRVMVFKERLEIEGLFQGAIPFVQ